MGRRDKLNPRMRNTCVLLNYFLEIQPFSFFIKIQIDFGNERKNLPGLSVMG
jgi:hypothetical protein